MTAVLMAALAITPAAEPAESAEEEACHPGCSLCAVLDELSDLSRQQRDTVAAYLSHLTEPSRLGEPR